MSSIISAFFSNDIVVTAIVSGLVVATGWITRKVGAWIGAKTEGESYANMLAKLGTTVEMAVLTVEQTLVPEIIKAKADGKITDDESNRLFAAADESVVKILGGDAGIDKLCKSVKMSRGAFDAMRRNMIEACVHKLTK